MCKILDRQTMPVHAADPPPGRREIRMHTNKHMLSERDICTRYLVPALVQAGWDLHRQVREEVTFTRGRVIVRGKLHSRGQARRADFILYHQPNLPLAVIEAKVSTLPVGAGMQQALDYADAAEDSA
jgi:type I restriction enzyme R subunit